MSIEDIAQDIELAQWERNNKPTGDSLKVYAKGDPNYGPEECQECGDEMPEKRREYGCKLCTHCQSIAERRRSGL